MKKFVLFSSLLLLLLVGGTTMSTCANFGKAPGKEYIEKFSKSLHYNKDEKVFINRKEEEMREMRKKAFSLSVFKEWFSKGVNRVPDHRLPEVKPDLNSFLKSSSDLKVIWFGHSTFLLNINGKLVLVDPVFSNAAPFSFMVKRFQNPVIELADLPKIDYVVISHDHYDHLDRSVMEFFANKETLFVTPLGVSSHLISWGIDSKRITELDWWQNHKVEGLEFISTPAQHFSGRSLSTHNSTLWSSWIIRNDQHNIYFSGDSGYDIHFKEIGDKYGPFDIAFIECGQYNEKWKTVHLLPDESIQSFFDLKAKRFFPVHWGMFELAFHPWNEPILKVHEASQKLNINLVSPKIGQVITLNDDYKNEPWW